MSSPTYYFEKINEAINKPKGDHAYLVIYHERYINELLDHYKGYLSEVSFSEAEVLAEELRDYITQNYTRKFKTVGYTRKLVSDLKAILGYS